MTLRSLPGTPRLQPSKPFLASADDGFSLHAGVAAGADERQKVARLCRYIARPAIAAGRLSLTGQGQVRYTLKTSAERHRAMTWAQRLKKHGLNDMAYSNPRYDALLLQASQEADPAARMALLEAAERIMLDDMPILPIYMYVTKRVVKPWVAGYVDNIMDYHHTRHYRILKH